MTKPIRVGAILFPGFELLDVFGPLEMFGLLGDRARISMLGDSVGTIRSAQGPLSVSEVCLADAGELDVFLVPGGRGTRLLVEDAGFLKRLRELADRTNIVASVCTGSAVLAKAGLLDGKRATTNKLSFDWVVTQGLGVTWVRKARWVQDDRIFTSSGVSAGMDMTLGLIEHLLGRDASLEVARQAEYIWNDDKLNDPFAQR